MRGRVVCLGLRVVWALMLLALPWSARAVDIPHVTASMPADFASLATTQRVVLDVYLADRRLGQYPAEVASDGVRLLDAQAVAASIPELLDPAAVVAALARPLPPTCREDACPPITAEYNPAAFRLTLTIAPWMLAVRGAAADYLDDSASSPSAVDTISLAIAGGGGSGTAYAIRNRLVAGTGALHVLSDLSLSSWDGDRLDTLAIERDDRDLRWRGGLFYAPGADLIGRRRIIGLGIATQFDTRADRVALSGTPLIVFLTQRSRVDLYVQGRLVGSQVCDSGNQALDTSALADGSYPVELRIQEASGAVRLEQRFFTRSAALAPAGRVMFDAQLGVLASEGHKRRVPIATGSARARLGSHLAWDTAVTATPANAVMESGLSLLMPQAQARIALLGSRRGDYGMAAQLSSGGGSPFSYSLDARRVRSIDGKPLIADNEADRLIATSMMRPGAVRLPGASYTQILGTLSYSLPRGQVGLSAYLFRTGVGQTAYAVGPTARWSILRRDRLQLSATGQYARTQRGDAIAFGIQLQVLGPRSMLATTFGVQHGADGRAAVPVVETSASLHRDDWLGGAVDAGALVQRGPTGVVMQLTGERRGPLGVAAANVTGRTGDSGGVNYGLTAQTTLALTGRDLRLGAAGQNDSVLAIAVAGTRNASFELLVDEAVRGTVRGGQRITLAVPPYRRYRVRLRATGSELIAFDTRSRTVDVFPGSVVALDWTARPVRALFGRLVDRGGIPVADADLVADDAIAATDPRGFFQIQASTDARLTARTATGGTCTARLAAAEDAATTYTRLGDVVCLS